MRRIRFFIMAGVISTCLWACSAKETAETPATTAETKGTTESSETAAESESATEAAAENPPEGVDYQNIFFDYSDEITKLNAKTQDFTTPKADNLVLTIADKDEKTGVSLVPSVREDDQNDYYLNTYAAGSELTIRAEIGSASVQYGDDDVQELTVEDGAVTFEVPVLKAGDPVDGVITILLLDGTEYRIHTLHELLPDFEVYNNGKAVEGVYTFAVDKFLLRINTAGEIIYYRNLGCVTEGMVENFKAQDTSEGRFYTYFVELKPEWRNANGGFSSGMYVVMDENYREINYVTLNANEDKNHTHGEGYLDQHEFVMLGRDHWLSLSYTPMAVENIPEGGIDGKNTGFVHAGIIQEVKDGAVVQEINTVDYELFYGSALECNDYENSTDQATADDIKDYVHVNSVAVDPKDDNLIVSMRHQYAVYKFDRKSGEILWILGGTENQFDGLDDVLDENGNLFIGQHDAKYVAAELAGNDSTITVFDNHTHFQQNLTRTMEFILDEEAKTATATVINGSDLDAVNGKTHWATHCGSITHFAEKSVLIGWGLHAIFDNNPEMAPNHPVFTDYDPITEEITFELNVKRNPLIESHEGCFSYRTYKNEF